MTNFTMPQDDEFDIDDSEFSANEGQFQSGRQPINSILMRKATAHQNAVTQEEKDEDMPEWQPNKTESKFNHKELSSIKSAAKSQSTLSVGKTQELNRIAMTNQTDSTKLGKDTVSAIRALAAQQAQENNSSPQGFMSKLKKLLGIDSNAKR